MTCTIQWDEGIKNLDKCIKQDSGGFAGFMNLSKTDRGLVNYYILPAYLDVKTSITQYLFFKIIKDI
eukprot:CAMPEP_0170546712 /NCGR_PEP_ID=MMETSP0211-20121228/5049_1 /TAXON_ID=311385 /ORGANISM="Pseudokeronopsis sp., Strain OXSARD2" /LENGTH=66 /DNA_ID=CAMNT_0010851305 /DNA_START=1713 /DNA_END=1910 /DNA_ORIENTATION=-